MRTLLKIAWLAALLLAHIPLVLFSSVRGRGAGRTAASGSGVVVVTPFAPGDESGGARAVKDFLGVATRCADVRVISIQSLGQAPRWRASLGAALSWPLPIPPQCRQLIVGHPQLAPGLRQANVVVFEFFASALYCYLHRVAGRRVILRDHEVLVRKIAMERDAARGLAASVHGLRLATCSLVSRCVYASVDRIITLTDEDRAALLDRFPGLAGRVATIPVTFDMPDDCTPVPFPRTPARDLAFVANFFHRPNVDALVWFLRESAPYLSADFTLHLFGRDEPLDRLDLAAGPVKVVRHGFVADLGAASCGASIAIAPVISGGGVRIKNLALASLGKAIVTTPLGNQGIGFTDGHDAVVTEDGREMARRIQALSEAPEQIALLGERARTLVRDRFGRDAVLRQVCAELGAR